MIENVTELTNFIMLFQPLLSYQVTFFSFMNHVEQMFVTEKYEINTEH